MEQKVDLSAGYQGLMVHREGTRWWCPSVDGNGDSYSVRYESGWYATYHRDGRGKAAGVVVDRDGTEIETKPADDIVEFTPMSWNEAERLGIKTHEYFSALNGRG